jgi:hypothetical protein
LPSSNGPCHCRRRRTVDQRIADALVVTFEVIVCDELTNEPTKVPLPQRHDPIQAFLFDRSDEAFCVRSGRDPAQQPAPQAMAEFCEAPTLVVRETQPLSLKTDLQHTILFSEKRDHVLVFTLSPRAQHREDELERRHGPKSTLEAVDRWWDTTGAAPVYQRGRRATGASDSGHLQIELRGNLAAMLSAATNAKRSPETGDLELQVSLVAGAGYQLDWQACLVA